MTPSDDPKRGSDDRPRGSLDDGVWLVLGGGGLRGLAHIGVWKALEEEGVRCAGILGTSIGALMGACIAAGMSSEDLAARARALQKEDIVRINRRVVWINGVKSPSLYQAESLQDYISSVLPTRRWSDLEIPVQVNAVNLGSGEMEWFGPGARTDVAPADAVYASAALPLFYPPARLAGGHFVDGGAGEALPLHRARELGASEIIAVDVGSGAQGDGEAAVEGGLITIHQRVFSIMAGRRRRENVRRWQGPPLLFIRPEVDRYSGFDFGAVEYFLEEGYRAAREALRTWVDPRPVTGA